MTNFESSLKTIYNNRKPVFGFLSNLSNFRSLLPEGTVKNFQVDNDRCSFSVDGLGNIGVRMVSADPDNKIKFESEGAVPFRFNLLVELEEKGDNITTMKLLFDAELNMMMKMVAQKPIEDGLEMIASKLSDHLNGSQLS